MCYEYADYEAEMDDYSRGREEEQEAELYHKIDEDDSLSDQEKREAYRAELNRLR